MAKLNDAQRARIDAEEKVQDLMEQVESTAQELDELRQKFQEERHDQTERLRGAQAQLALIQVRSAGVSQTNKLQ